jgi:phage replication-related protein YjqB (UPF0714/DUF867 family)
MATNLRPVEDLLRHERPFAHLLAQPDVSEEVVLGSRFGFMAFHGGYLEEVTDDIALEAARRAGASSYIVCQPDARQWHIPSHRVDPAESPKLAGFLDHVDITVAIHGYGLAGHWRTVLLGGGNRLLAEHIAVALIPRCPYYEVRCDIEHVPTALRGLHAANPVNLPRHGGVQVELPPRIRGQTPLWANWKGPGRVPHLEALIDGLAHAATAWPERVRRRGRAFVPQPAQAAGAPSGPA